jgi:hypothetical protein
MIIDKDDFIQQTKPLKRKSTGNCLFCKSKMSNKQKSNEHIIPTWLQKYLGIQDTIISPSIYT